MRPEAVPKKIQARWVSQHHCKAGSGLFCLFRVIVLPNLDDDLAGGSAPRGPASLQSGDPAVILGFR
jgi:hypothetical protein